MHDHHRSNFDELLLCRLDKLTLGAVRPLPHLKCQGSHPYYLEYNTYKIREASITSRLRTNSLTASMATIATCPKLPHRPLRGFQTPTAESREWRQHALPCILATSDWAQTILTDTDDGADVLRRSTISGGARASSPPRTRRFQDKDDLVPQPHPHPQP